MIDINQQHGIEHHPETVTGLCDTFPTGNTGARNVSQIPKTEAVYQATAEGRASSVVKSSDDQHFTPALDQRAVSVCWPESLELSDRIRQQVERELNESKLCCVYFIPSHCTAVRFTETAKEGMYEAGLSKEEVSSAIKLSDGECDVSDTTNSYYFDRYHFVENRRVNDYLDQLFENGDCPDVLEGCDVNGLWRVVVCETFPLTEEPLCDARYFRISDALCGEDYGVTEPCFEADKQKYIADRIADYLASTIRVFGQALCSNRSDSNKVMELGGILFPDLSDSHPAGSSNAGLQESNEAHLSATEFLERIDFAPHGTKYLNLLNE